MRILGLDYGSKTVGVAVCDPLGMTAQGVETITRKEENKLRKTLARIEALVEEYQVETIVLGYPKNMDDSIGERAKKTEEFRDMLVRSLFSSFRVMVSTPWAVMPNGSQTATPTVLDP